MAPAAALLLAAWQAAHRAVWREHQAKDMGAEGALAAEAALAAEERERRKLNKRRGGERYRATDACDLPSVVCAAGTGVGCSVAARSLAIQGGGGAGAACYSGLSVAAWAVAATSFAFAGAGCATIALVRGVEAVCRDCGVLDRDQKKR